MYLEGHNGPIPKNWGPAFPKIVRPPTYMYVRTAGRTETKFDRYPMCGRSVFLLPSG